MISSRYFTEQELACPCCGLCLIDDKLVLKLDEARHLAGIPFPINSGYRCQHHNEMQGGVSGSAHLEGLAVDIAVGTNISRFLILDSLLTVGFLRIGIGKNYIHADLSTDHKVQKTIWIYF
jgi:uncharacterized protein YcbK (DUF882 family)